MTVMFIDPGKTRKYRVRKIVLLGLKNREKARRELRKIELEKMFANAMIAAYAEIASKSNQSFTNNTETSIN